MKLTTFKIDNTNKNNYSFPTTDYSAILDNIIATNIAENNKYLFNYGKSDGNLIDALIKDSKKKHGTTIFTSSILKGNDEFTKAANFLANYKKSKAPKNLPFIFGKTYKLTDGTPIAFYDDEIQIGMDLYSYDDFGSITFLKKLPTATKNIIINIYNAGNTTINIY